MNVVVTGGRGASGRWIVDRLVREGHAVTCLDRDHPGFGAGHEDVAYRALDLTDAGAVLDTVTAVDPDTVVHWGAIPAAGRHPGVDLYRNNSLGAYNVLTAAGRVGARVVQASSDGAYGFFFADPTPVPDEHPLRPEDPYGLSKVVAEEIGATVARRDGVSVASLRPSWIQYPGEYACRDPGYVEDLSAGAGNYWSYVDIRDVVDCVCAALGADFDGHEAFNCVAPDNALGRPLVDLLAEEFGRVPDETAVEGDGSAYSTAKAAALLDWEPSHSWREAADADVPGPDPAV